jgi:23S rRNA pseudouridine1911/1915/1917 synthase
VSARRGHVVHATARIVVVDKPPGVSLATRRAEPQAAVARLVESLADNERARHGLDPATLLLVHRLDVGTSGLVVVARDAEAHRQLARAFAEQRVEKTYLALCWGHPRPRQGRFDAALGPDRRDRRRMRADPAGRRALTHYRCLAAPPHASLVELRPETGRTHQIRVHLAHAGHPIVGDDLYGGPRERAVRDRALRAALTPAHPLLHAWRLALPEPDADRLLVVCAPPPPSFRRALHALGIDLAALGAGPPDECAAPPSAGAPDARSAPP